MADIFLGLNVLNRAQALTDMGPGPLLKSVYDTVAKFL